MASSESSKSELAGGLLMLGVAAAVGLVTLSGAYAPSESEFWLVVTWTIFGGFRVLRGRSARFRRVWFSPRSRSVAALLAFVAASYLSATGENRAAGATGAFGLLAAAGAVVESERRGPLAANPFFRLLVGAVGLGFVAFAGYLARNYPYFGVTVVAATSAVTGLALLAWGVLMTVRD